VRLGALGAAVLDSIRSTIDDDYDWRKRTYLYRSRQQAIPQSIALEACCDVMSSIVAGWTYLDSQFEEELAKNPYSVKNWCNYIQTKKDQPPLSRYTLYERALSFLPRSYKLWHAYLQDRTTSLKGKTIRNRKYELLIETYERSLVYMNKMPRIW
jgi:hypothetical protein